MTFSITLFVLSWISFLLFADKSRFFQIAPTCYIAMYLASTTDMMTNVYPLWVYPAPDKIHMFFRHVLHDTGVYPVVTYLFLQTLPKVQTVFKVIRHMFYWSLLALAIELLATKTGNITHGLWWSTWWSYGADWGLFVFFYKHYKWRKKHTGDGS